VVAVPRREPGDLVIGAFVLARLLGMRLLTLEARIVVRDDDGAIRGRFVRAPAAPERRGLSPARPGPRVLSPPPPRRRGAMSAGYDQLARAVELVGEGADTLERTRRAQYRG
jgi:hypothetical protein